MFSISYPCNSCSRKSDFRDLFLTVSLQKHDVKLSKRKTRCHAMQCCAVKPISVLKALAKLDRFQHTVASRSPCARHCIRTTRCAPDQTFHDRHASTSFHGALSDAEATGLPVRSGYGTAQTVYRVAASSRRRVPLRAVAATAMTVTWKTSLLVR